MIFEEDINSSLFLALEYILIHPVCFLRIQINLLNKFIIGNLNETETILVSFGNKQKNKTTVKISCLNIL